jgi:hypothetical protein
MSECFRGQGPGVFSESQISRSSRKESAQSKPRPVRSVNPAVAVEDDLSIRADLIDEDERNAVVPADVPEEVVSPLVLPDRIRRSADVDQNFRSLPDEVVDRIDVVQVMVDLRALHV